MNTRILIAPAGWEDRYLEGVKYDTQEFMPHRIVVPFSSQYRARTAFARQEIATFANDQNIEYREQEHDYSDSAELYRSLHETYDNAVKDASSVRFNVTTSPRDVIWYFLHFLSIDKIPAEFSYFRPKEYPDTYLSRDARAPRLVIKRSGIAYPDLPTCVLALAGYDHERLWQLDRRFEPKTMLIGVQSGDQLGNEVRKVSLEIDRRDGLNVFEFDCYDVSSHAVDQLKQKLKELSEPHNVIAASLGPKPSALTLFRLTQELPEVALAYIPAADYSARYSEGVDIVSRTLSELVWQDREPRPPLI